MTKSRNRTGGRRRSKSRAHHPPAQASTSLHSLTRCQAARVSVMTKFRRSGQSQTHEARERQQLKVSASFPRGRKCPNPCSSGRRTSRHACFDVLKSMTTRLSQLRERVRTHDEHLDGFSGPCLGHVWTCWFLSSPPPPHGAFVHHSENPLVTEGQCWVPSFSGLFGGSRQTVKSRHFIPTAW